MDVEQVKELPVQEQVALLAKAKEELEEAKKLKTEKQKEFDALRLVVLPETMEKLDINSISTKHGVVTLSSDLRAYIPAEKREMAQQWLTEHGFGDLVKPTVNASSLKALAKELMMEGEALPDEIFNVQPFTRANIKLNR